MADILTSAVVKRAARWLNPVVASPGAPLESATVLNAFSPSLMPRSSIHLGLAAGVGVLTARTASNIVEGATFGAVPSTAGIGPRLALRVGVIGAGSALAALPEEPDESLPRAGLRSAGDLTRAAAVGGLIYEVGTYLSSRREPRNAVRPLLGAALGTAGLAYWAGRRLQSRRDQIERWPVPQPSTVPGALGVGAAVVGVGLGSAALFRLSRGAIISYLGPGLTKNVLGRAANAGLWAAGLSAAYNAGVGYIGRANEKIEPGYRQVPSEPRVSGGPDSIAPYDELGLQGRRYVSHTLNPDHIEAVMGEPAQAPIRTYVGFNSEPVYAQGRAEMALEELDRTGAFDRSHLLLVAPTGTGWVDHAVIEAAELWARGDIASCCIQYGRFPSFLCVQKLPLGRQQFRLLLWGVQQRLAERAPEDRPKVLVFGESLGAWTASDVVMYQGIEGFDHYGIDRALWFGLPGLAKWSRNGMDRGANDLVPEGTVRVFDHPDELEALSDEERDRLRAVILSHANDPIAAMRPELIIQEPDWLRDDERGRGIPEAMEWSPIGTFAQVVVDAANAMVTVPGKFKSFGHDYRGDTARIVRDAFHFEASGPEQTDAVETALRDLEMARTERIKTESDEVATLEDRPATMVGGVPLAERRTGGPRWLQSLIGRAER
jgi:uncharacterized membrane protein